MITIEKLRESFDTLGRSIQQFKAAADRELAKVDPRHTLCQSCRDLGDELKGHWQEAGRHVEKLASLAHQALSAKDLNAAHENVQRSLESMRTAIARESDADRIQGVQEKAVESEWGAWCRGVLKGLDEVKAAIENCSAACAAFMEVCEHRTIARSAQFEKVDAVGAAYGGSLFAGIRKEQVHCWITSQKRVRAFLSSALENGQVVLKQKSSAEVANWFCCKLQAMVAILDAGIVGTKSTTIVYREVSELYREVTAFAQHTAVLIQTVEFERRWKWVAWELARLCHSLRTDWIGTVYVAFHRVARAVYELDWSSRRAASLLNGCVGWRREKAHEMVEIVKESVIRISELQDIVEFDECGCDELAWRKAVKRLTECVHVIRQCYRRFACEVDCIVCMPEAQAGVIDVWRAERTRFAYAVGEITAAASTIVIERTDWVKAVRTAVSKTGEACAAVESAVASLRKSTTIQLHRCTPILATYKSQVRAICEKASELSAKSGRASTLAELKKSACAVQDQLGTLLELLGTASEGATEILNSAIEANANLFGALEQASKETSAKAMPGGAPASRGKTGTGVALRPVPEEAADDSSASTERGGISQEDYVESWNSAGESLDAMLDGATDYVGERLNVIVKFCKAEAETVRKMINPHPLWLDQRMSERRSSLQNQFAAHENVLQSDPRKLLTDTDKQILAAFKAAIGELIADSGERLVLSATDAGTEE